MAATGSGILIEGGYVVTNYHVVWPYPSAWIAFPDGTELASVPVVAWDPMADLALLGPVSVPAQPLTFTNGEDMSLGGELFLVGYPHEVDLLPRPTITRGILSRIREWGLLGITYFQTDALAGAGQSGGALVNSKGEIIGLSTFSFGDAGFGLAASSIDILPIVAKLIAGEFTSGLGDRRLPTGLGSFTTDIALRNLWDERTFVLDAAPGVLLEVELDGLGDGWFHVSDAFGPVLEVDDGLTGTEYGIAELRTGGVHFLQVEMASGDSSDFQLSSNVRIKAVNDPDDGRAISVGETIPASIDNLSDWDWFSLHLQAGETVRIATDSLNVDTLLYVDFPKSRTNQLVSDDDSGGGLSGLNSELIYRAPHAGEYFVVVTEALGDAVGGYYLSVERSGDGTETVIVPPSPETVNSPFGNMVVFQAPWDRFSVHVPESWTELVADESLGQLLYAYDPGTTSDIFIGWENILDVGLGELTLSEYADLIETSVLIPNNATEITRELLRTAQGLPAIRLNAALGGFRLIRFIYVSDDHMAFSITHSFPAERLDSGGRLADYVLSTFHVN